MKLLFTLSFLFCSIFACFGQAYEFKSFQSYKAIRDEKGILNPPSEWINREVFITLDLDKEKLEIFSKNMLDRDTIKKEKIIESIRFNKHFTDKNDNNWTEFTGVDDNGKKCLVKFESFFGQSKESQGNLYLEYGKSSIVFTIRGLQSQLYLPVPSSKKSVN